MNRYTVVAPRFVRSCFACLVTVMVAFGEQRPTNADASESAKLLPKTVIAFAEIPNLGGTITTIYDHPLRQRLVPLLDDSGVFESDQFKQFTIGVNAFEGTMKQSWQEAIKSLSDGGVTFALDAANGGVALLVKSSEQASLKKFREFLIALRTLSGDSSKPSEYRGFQAYAFGDDLKMAFVNDWFLVTNKSELGKSIIDRYVDGGDDCLNANERFQNALHDRSKDARLAVFGYVDIQAVREGGMAKDVFNERVDNFVGELVFGGILANLQNTPYVALNLHAEIEGLKLQLLTPHDRKWESPREYYFGTPEHASAPTLLNVQDRLFAVSSHRDISQMWLRSGDLLTERANDGLAQADTQLTTFFSGRDFGEDILGSLGGDIQFVGKPQDFTGQLPQPAIKLPAFAIQFRMKDPATTQPELRRIFQSFIGFLNVIGAMEAQPQFDLDMDSVGEAKLYTASYVAAIDERESLTAPINFNFSPTLAFHGEHVVLSSATPLARELVTAENDIDLASATKLARRTNTAATIDGNVLQQLLQANKKQLVANSMLEKGHSEESAAAEVELLLVLLGFFNDIQLSLDVSDSHLQLNVNLSVDTDPVD